MTTELATLIPTPAPGLPAVAAAFDLHSAVLSGRNANSARAYRGDYEDFARFLGAASAAAALESLIALAPGTANACALAYRAHLVERGLSPATVARRLAALRSAVRLARQLGRVNWTLEVEAPRVEAYRDTAGPGRAGWRAILEVARQWATTAKGRRDLALIRLLHDLGLRRAEAVGLDLADVDLERGVVMVLGKGRTGRVPLTLPPPTRGALADWLAARGPEPGPVFVRLDRGDDGAAKARLTCRSVNRVVGVLGRAAQLSRPVRPHGLRHEAITRALDATGGDVRAVRKFSRHRKIETLLAYDDNLRDLAGDVARLVADD
jgi:integrase/recombinase XerC